MRRVRGRHAKQQFSKQIVVLVILLYVAFVMGVWIVGTGPTPFTTPDSLIVGVTAFLGSQLWNLKDIKKEKIRKGEQTNDQC